MVIVQSSCKACAGLGRRVFACELSKAAASSVRSGSHLLQLPGLPAADRMLVFRPTAVYRTLTPGGREEPTVLLKAGATTGLSSRSQAGSIAGPRGQKVHLDRWEVSQRETCQPWLRTEDASHRLVRAAEASGQSGGTAGTLLRGGKVLLHRKDHPEGQGKDGDSECARGLAVAPSEHLEDLWLGLY